MVQRRAIEYWPDGLPGMRIVHDAAALHDMARQLMNRKFVFDLETSGVAWHRGSRAVGASFATWRAGVIVCWYVPFRHATGEKQISETLASRVIRDLLLNSKMIIGHNLKFDEHFSVLEGWRFGGPRYDTMVAASLFDENLPLKLETRVERHLGVTDSLQWNSKVRIEVATLAKQRGLKRQQYLSRYGYSEVPINLLGIYACHDAWYTARLYDYFEGKHSLSSTYSRIWPTEMALVRIIGNMERYGLLVDTEYLEKLRETLLVEKERLTRRVVSEFGQGLNPGSDKEMQDLLYKGYKLPIIKYTKALAPSVDSEILQYYASRVPGLKVIQKWRDVEKLLSTYTTSILDRLDASAICHPNFQQVGTNTGRMSCREPNFQNQPNDNPERAKANGGIDPWSIRRAFIVRKEGSKVFPRLFFDYSQVELRVLAYYTRDPIMVDVYLHGGDIHERTQKEVGAVLGKEVERRQAKMVNFGLSYGLTAMGLARRSGMAEPEAEAFLKAFDQQYAGIGQFRFHFWNAIRAQPGLWFANLWGRRGRLPNINSPDARDRKRAERQAIGRLIQGQAAELTKESLVRLDSAFSELGLPVSLCNVVHDDIQMDADPRALVDICRVAKLEMERYSEFSPIPIKVDGDYSLSSWAQKQKLPK